MAYIDIPYLCFNIIYYPYWIVKYVLKNSDTVFFDYIKPLIGIPLLQFSTPISESLNGVTWFIAALLVMKIILSICNKYKYGHLSMSVITIIIGLIYIVNEYYRLYTDLPFVGFVRCLPFSYLGFLSRQKNIISEKPQKKDLLFCFAGFLISLAIYSYERTTSGLYIYGICFWAIFITAIIGTVCLCKMIDHIHLTIIDNISIGTIVIMALHWILIGFTNYPLSIIWGVQEIKFNVPAAIFLTLLYTAILYPIIILFKDKYPFMLGKQTTTVDAKASTK